MKKIIAFINGLEFSENSLSDFSYIIEKTHGSLTISMLEDITGDPVPLMSNTPGASFMDYDKLFTRSLEERRKKISDNMKHVRDYYIKRGVAVALHNNPGSPVQEVLKESRFADLIMLHHTTSFSAVSDSNPPRFVKNVLAAAECPVMILPDKVIRIQEIIFAYNGSSSSMYAIRQFTQLFPELSDMPVNIVYVIENGNKSIPGETLLQEYLAAHYDDIRYTVLEGDPATEFLAMLYYRNDCVVTYGAYSRSGLSNFFHRSDADSVLSTINIPVFITHP
ncbi:universal stress protein [Chitinophaga alhagiae]|uniref:universal stress protein n=1 Tax=Chitinophaga alhagiae TaxID=2203219 RepID=UPI001300B347|nr:universal stress protein [Chitinophaga alhagiae]